MSIGLNCVVLFEDVIESKSINNCVDNLSIDTLIDVVLYGGFEVY